MAYTFTNRFPDPVVDDFNSLLFHAPFYKLVQKAFARLCFSDYKDGAATGLTETEKLEPLTYVFFYLSNLHQT